MRSYASPIFFLMLAILTIGCGRTSEQAQTPNELSGDTGQQAVAQQQPPQQGPIETGLKPDPAYPVPDLSPEQLLDYVNQMAALEPHGDTDAQYIADQVSRARSRLIAADRIILSPGVNKDLMSAAVRAKLDALKLLAMLDSKGLGVNFAKFIEALNESDSPEFAQLGRLSQFWFEVDKLAYGQAESPDALVADLKNLIANPNAGETEFLAAQDGGFILNDRGYASQATEMLNLVGNRFKDHPELGKEATDLLEKTEFREKVIDAMSGDKSQIRTLFLAIRDMLKDKEKLNVETLDNTLNAGQVLEFNGHFEEAGMVFEAIKKAYRNGEDKKLAKQAELSVMFAQKRLGLIGKEIEIEGTHMDGKAFNWEKYKGKVVLVDFWASTSSPWLSDLPNVKAAYDQFHDEGFEVVGINVDRVRENAYDFLSGERLPWATVMDDVAPGLDANPNAIRYGVQAVPFVMLVGRDGKVADIHVRGPQLTKKIDELINEPSSKNARKNAKKKPVR